MAYRNNATSSVHAAAMPRTTSQRGTSSDDCVRGSPVSNGGGALPLSCCRTIG